MSRQSWESGSSAASSHPPPYHFPPGYSTSLPPTYTKLHRLKATGFGRHAEGEETLLLSGSTVVAEDGKCFFTVLARPGPRRKRGG